MLLCILVGQRRTNKRIQKSSTINIGERGAGGERALGSPLADEVGASILLRAAGPQAKALDLEPFFFPQDFESAERIIKN